MVNVASHGFLPCGPLVVQRVVILGYHIGFVFGAAVGFGVGFVAGLGLDYGLLKLDETLNREEFRQELLDIIREEREKVLPS